MPATLAATVKPSGTVICCHRSVLLARESCQVPSSEPSLGKTSAELALGRRFPVRFSNRPGYECVGLAVENLRIHCPPALPVVVRAANTKPSIDGFCARRGNKFFIEISHRLSPEGVLNTLVHEWAHSLAWNFTLEKASQDSVAGEINAERFEEIAHGPEFGVAFAAVWRAFVKHVIPVLNMHAR